VVVLLRVSALSSVDGTITVNRCGGGTCNRKTVTTEERVTENSYSGGSLNCSG